MKAFSSLLDSNRERVGFSIFCVLLFFSKILCPHGNDDDIKTTILNASFIYNIDKSLQFTVNNFSKHSG